jgi:hypothetical protein
MKTLSASMVRIPSLLFTHISYSIYIYNYILYVYSLKYFLITVFNFGTIDSSLHGQNSHNSHLRYTCGRANAFSLLHRTKYWFLREVFAILSFSLKYWTKLDQKICCETNFQRRADIDVRMRSRNLINKNELRQWLSPVAPNKITAP